MASKAGSFARAPGRLGDALRTLLVRLRKSGIQMLTMQDVLVR
jgi:hypothetical protein